jgi:hypothetical protein
MQAQSMTLEAFESLSLGLGVGGLVLYMLFIMYRLAKDSGAGRLGALVIFLSLGLGIAGFAAKSVIQMMIAV